MSTASAHDVTPDAVDRVGPMTGTVSRISTTPVKGMALIDHDAVEVGPSGIVDDRAYALLDPAGQMVNGKRIGTLATIVPEVLHDPEVLRLRFPDGTLVEAEVELGQAVKGVFFGQERPAHEVGGPFSAALTAWAGQPLRLVHMDDTNGGIDRWERRGSLSLLSTDSLRSLAAAAGLGEPLDARRFRMSVLIDGIPAYAEDEWLDRPVRVGGTLVRPGARIGRCVVTSHDPDTGIASLDTLELLRATRGDIVTKEPMPFGVWAEVVEPGTIRLGDPVIPTDVR